MASTSINNTVWEQLDFTKFHNIINGKLASSTITRCGINPATEEPTPEVPVATSQDVEDAIESARAAFEGWKGTPLEDRKKALQSLAAALNAHKSEFAKLLTFEQGKPVSTLPISEKHLKKI